SSAGQYCPRTRRRSTASRPPSSRPPPSCVHLPARRAHTFPRPSRREHHCDALKERAMESKKDDLKGRVKEAAGDLTDDEDLKREGKTDRAGASLKDRIEKATENGEELVDKPNDMLRHDYRSRTPVPD